MIMSLTKNMLWSKLRLSFVKKDRHGKEEDVNSLMDKVDVNVEYKEAFRTKSYIEISNKVQCHLNFSRISIDEENPFSSLSSASLLTSPFRHNDHLSQHLPVPRQETLISTLDEQFFENLLDPHQETQISTIERSNLPQCLVNYFEIMLDACRVCEFLLATVNRIQKNQRSLKKLIKSIKRVPDISGWTNNQYHSLYTNFATFASNRNPFLYMTPKNFHELHNRHVILYHELTSQCRKAKRRTKFTKFVKIFAVCLIVAGCGALAIALMILATQIMTELVAAPSLVIFTLLGLLILKKMREGEWKNGKSWLERVYEQLDTAARGVYILIHDFETVSRLVQRLNDEIEHMKFVVNICVRRRNNEMLKEVVKEFQMHEGCFVEELDELEKQIYLCFLDINRSIRQVMQQMHG